NGSEFGRRGRERSVSRMMTPRSRNVCLFIAVLLVLQAPGILAGRPDASPGKPRHDSRIEAIERGDHVGDRVRVLVSLDDGTDGAAALRSLRAHGLRIRRQHRGIHQWAIELRDSDLAWLDALRGIGSI